MSQRGMSRSRSRMPGNILALIGAWTLWSLLPPAASFVPGRPPASQPRLAPLRAVEVESPPKAEAKAETTPKKAQSPEEDQETFRMMSLTLLQRVQDDKFEDLELPDELNFEQFKGLLAKLDLADTSPEHAERIFKMLDQSKSGTVSREELRVSLRNSDAIAEMYSESLKNVGVTVASALALAAVIGVALGWNNAADFLTAYVVEDSLSVDNLFVFLLLFNYFKVPPSLQSYCLNLGIYGAVVLRAFFIFVGLSAVKAFQPLLLFFAAFLIYASYTGLTEGDDDEEEGEGEPPEFVQGVLSALPTTDKFQGDKLYVEGPNGGWLLTPLALCIIAVELCDILFAVDSIPAVFAVTDDPVIVLSSNLAAIIGLRSLYQVLSVAASDLVYLEKAVAVILGFVGVKLGLEVFDVEVSSALSLGVIIGVLGVGVGASLYEQNKDEYNNMFTKPKSVDSYFGKILKNIQKIGK